jgi:hypothetical protein
MTRINNPQSCIVCVRHSAGLAVGLPKKLGWYCEDCWPSLARKALYMKNLDGFELEACHKVAGEINRDNEGNLLIAPEELPAFIGWVVKRFSEVMRKSVEDGEAPF